MYIYIYIYIYIVYQPSKYRGNNPFSSVGVP